jgi:NAD(P)-dependent dehydrogenase (short-subunit alcohol dehydrogenase family)
MKAANWGRILFIASESAVNIPVEMIHYGVTKTMQVALARGLAESTVGTGVTVNSILAGPTRSEGVEGFIANVVISKNSNRLKNRHETAGRGRAGGRKC